MSRLTPLSQGSTQITSWDKAMTLNYPKVVSSPGTDPELYQMSFQPQICISMQQSTAEGGFTASSHAPLLTQCFCAGCSYRRITDVGTVQTPKIVLQMLEVHILRVMIHLVQPL